MHPVKDLWRPHGPSARLLHYYSGGWVATVEQVSALAERIRVLKQIAASMQEGAIHTRLFPEIDKILAFPDDLSRASVGEREAVTRQVREYEQTFDQLGYSLLKQNMPTTGVSSIFQVVQAAEAFKGELKGHVGRPWISADGEERQLDHHDYDVLTRHSLSIGTPPVTAGMGALVCRMVLGRELSDLLGFTEFLGAEPTELEQLLRLLEQLMASSLHYCTAGEEAAFLLQAAEQVNFEGGRIFNRVVITASPERVIHLICDHLFDKFGPSDAPPVRQVPGLDALDGDLRDAMAANPNQVFVARVTRIPYRLVLGEDGAPSWRNVIGRLVLVDCSERARQSNVTIVYTLFPHVARTLRNIQNSFAGRPANTQLHLRQLLERFSVGALARIRQAVEQHMALSDSTLEGLTVDQVRVEEWQRHALFDHLALAKLRRLLRFLERVADPTPQTRREQGTELARQVCRLWMDYFYRGMPTDDYSAAVVPGGGRGALTLIGEYHRQRATDAAERFRTEHMAACRQRLAASKEELAIPGSSTEEIQAGIRQTELGAQSPSQWQRGRGQTRLADHLRRSVLYRLTRGAGRLTRRTRDGLDRAAFGNITGGAAAYVKRTMSGAGLGALHGRLEEIVGQRVGRYDRKMRDSLVPIQDLIQTVQGAVDEVMGELDPVPISEIEAELEQVQQGHFYPSLVLPELSWSYGDVFPERYFPSAGELRVPLNGHNEMDPLALLTRLEELRYLFRGFPELFRLHCQGMLLVINSPHNPTGIHYRRETILRLLKIASEYDLAVVDDNSYHKLVFSGHKAREGEDNVAQVYEKYRSHFPRAVRLLTAAATTKALQGAGDRTGFFCSNDAEAVDYVRQAASEPHQLSLFLTRAKLEVGLQVKAVTAELELCAGRLVDPTIRCAPWEEVRALLEQMLPRLGDEDLPVVVFEALLAGYEELLRARQRGAHRHHYSEHISRLVSTLKDLRLERRLRRDVERRVEQVREALARALPEAEVIEPQGAFYYCFRICPRQDAAGLQEFLCALSRRRKVDLTSAGGGYLRISLGGKLQGDPDSYRRLGQTVQVYLEVLGRYWRRFKELDRDPERLDQELRGNPGDALGAALADIAPLLAIHPPAGQKPGLVPSPAERGTIYCIEEGRSVADKVFVVSAGCQSVEAMLRSASFRVVYRRLLRRVYRDSPALSETPLHQLENQFGPLACMAAYRDRQLIDDDFRDIMRQLYRAWHSQSTIRALAAHLRSGHQAEKAAALHGLGQKINELVNELMYAFEVPEEEITANSSFDLGLELLEGVRASEGLPPYLRHLIQRVAFAGAVAPLSPAPTYVTGATRRISDYRYGFIRRDGQSDDEDDGRRKASGVDFFQGRLDDFVEHFDPDHYLCKAVQVGPFPILLVVHKSCLHLLSDELRLFPQIDAVRRRDRLDGVDWQGVLLFGLPAKVVGDSYKTGYVVDRLADGAPLPTAWVAREDATDYVGFLKKSLLTLHNEQVKALGGMPVHGAMITITFKNGLRKTLVFSADSGTGKSETITAMMEQTITATGSAADLSSIDILAGDMLSLWRGEDKQVYAFGTETGDFLRLSDITPRWKARFGDLLNRGSYSNLDHPTNPRVTIPGICDSRKVLSPTRVNGFFYINNYEGVRGSAVELSDDPHQVLKDVLVRGLRKNKGTSGDQPNLRAGLAFAGRADLVTRYQHSLDELLQWQNRVVDHAPHTCLCFRDGAGDVYAAREVVTAAFEGRSVGTRSVRTVDHDVMENLFWLECEGGERLLLDRAAYDQIYEPLVSTFCGNPFVDPRGMDRTLDLFAETFREARVHTGVICTQLARPGQEFSGPDRAAGDVIDFLLEDEEVNARYQRNKDRVHEAMQRYYGGVLQAGGNLPLELEGYNLLLLEKYESTHVRFLGAGGEAFTVSTPFYDYAATRSRGEFVPAVALPEMLASIADICANPDHELDLDELEVEQAVYESVHHHNSIEELIYQVLLVNGVINLGSSETELARFPGEVRKARHVAEALQSARSSI